MQNLVVLHFIVDQPYIRGKLSEEKEFAKKLSKMSSKTTEAKSKNRKAKDAFLQCGKCDTKLEATDKKIQCSTCTTQFHTSCQEVSDKLLEIITDETNGILWFCNICKKTTRGMIQKMSNMELRLQAIEAARITDHSEMQALSKLVKSLQDSNNTLENKVKQLVDEKQADSENQEKMLQTISSIRRDLYKEQDKNVTLQAKLDEMDQRQRNKNVRVVGFPEHDNEDSNISNNLIQLVGAEIPTESIVSTTRMGRKREGKHRDLVVQFSNQKTRDQFYASRKNTPKDNENKKVFINEDLTEARAKLFYDSRQMVKRGKIYGTWSQNGNIMVKVSENDSPMVIYSHQDLASLTRFVSTDTMSVDDMLSSDDMSEFSL